MIINLTEVFNNQFKKSGIYIIENIKTSKSYIGSSKSILKRWKQHVRMLQKNKHHSCKLQRSYNKNNEGNFQFRIILECPEEYLEELEQWYLTNMEPSYNMTLVVVYNNNLTCLENKSTTKFKKGHTPTESNKKSSSLSNKGNKYCLGYKHTEDFLNTLRKPIIQYDKNGNFISEWNSIKEAAAYIQTEGFTRNKSKESNITNCLTGFSKSAYGYRWEYKSKII